MRLKLTRPIATLGNHGTRLAFNVVIAYEDFVAGKRAMDLCKPLVSLLGDEVHFGHSMWKFDILKNLKLRQIAVEDAINADVIIVATTRQGDLPGSTKEWIHSWVPFKRGQTAGLLALIGSEAEDLLMPNLTYSFLEKAAADSGIEFLPQTVESTDDPWPLSAAVPIEALSGRIVNRPTPEGWGLND